MWLWANLLIRVINKFRADKYNVTPIKLCSNSKALFYKEFCVKEQNPHILTMKCIWELPCLNQRLTHAYCKY